MCTNFPTSSFSRGDVLANACKRSMNKTLNPIECTSVMILNAEVREFW